MIQIKKILEAIGLISLTFIIIFSLCELLLRIFYIPFFTDDPTFKKSLNNENICNDYNSDPYDDRQSCYAKYDNLATMKFNTYFGYVPVENFSGNGFKTNNKGMRYDKDIVEEKNIFEKRVFVTGGSTAWGAGVDQTKLYTKVAEDFINKNKNESIKVISAGVGGYVSTHEILRFHYYIRPLKPDIWVMLTGWNDVYTGYRGLEYVLSPDMMNLKDAFYRSRNYNIYWKEKFIEEENLIFPPAWGDYFFKTQAFIEKLIYKINYARSTNKINIEKFSQDKIVDLVISNIRNAALIAKDNNIKLIVILQPSIYSTNKKLSKFEHDILQSSRQSYPGLSEYFKYSYEEIDKKLKLLSTSENLFEYFNSDNAISNEKQSVFADACHLGDRGNRLLGQFLGRIIESCLSKKLQLSHFE